MITVRQYDLLEALIKEYVATASPVSSARLAQRMRGSLSPATVRHELRQLEEIQLLFQPHTSAGRMPTDHGYRYYIDHAVVRQLSSAQERRLTRQLRAYEHSCGHLMQAAAKVLAQCVQTLSITGSIDSQEVHEAGIGEMLEQAHEMDMETLQEIARALAAINRIPHNLYVSAAKRARVFIGEENPLMHARYTSLLLRAATTSHGERMVLLVVGPKRMPYQRNVAVVNALAHVVSQNT